MRLRRDTNTILFNEVVALAKANGDFDKVSPILDCEHAETYKVKELKDCEFDFVAKVVWGSNEGIYIHCYLEGTFDNSGDKRLNVGTLKTLSTSLQDFQVMGELAGALTYHARQYVDKNIDRYARENGKRSTEADHRADR